MTKDTKTNESKLKSTLNGASYTRLYFYLGIFVAIFCSYLFFFKTNDTSDILLQSSSSKTTTVQIESNTDTSDEVVTEDVVEDNNTTDAQTTENTSETTATAAETISSNTGLTASSPEQPVATQEPAVVAPAQPETTAPATTSNDDGLIPSNNYNKQYAAVATKSFVVKKGQSLSALFKENSLSQADINAMDGVNRKAASSLHDGDKILIKVQDKKVVVLAIVKKNGDYFGQFVWTGDKYEFIGK